MEEVQQSFGNLLYQLEENAREAFRRLEKCRRRLIQNRYAGLFNSTCIKEKLLPNYSKIQLTIIFKARFITRNQIDQKVSNNMFLIKDQTRITS